MTRGQLYRGGRVRRRARKVGGMTFGAALMFALPWTLPSLLFLAWTSWDAVTRMVW